MEMVILGAGPVGKIVTQYIATQQNNAGICVVDTDAELLDFLENQYQIRTVHVPTFQHMAQPETLKHAGLQKSKDQKLLALTKHDEQNLLACQMAHALFQTPFKMARLSSEAYMGLTAKDIRNEVFSPENLPVDALLTPALDVAHELYKALFIPGVFRAEELCGGKVHFWTMAAAALAGQGVLPISNAHQDVLSPYLIGSEDASGQFMDAKNTWAALRKAKSVMDLRFRNIMWCVPEKDRKAFLKTLGFKQQKPKQVLVLGGGRIGGRLALWLAHHGIGVTVVESQRASAQWLAEKSDDIRVMHGDALDETLFELPELQKFDAVVATTEQDGINVLGSMFYAQNMKQHSPQHVPNVMSILRGSRYLGVAENAGLHQLIQPREVALRYVMNTLENWGDSQVPVGLYGHQAPHHMLHHGKILEENTLGKVLLGQSIRRPKLPKHVKILWTNAQPTEQKIHFEAGDEAVVLVKN